MSNLRVGLASALLVATFFFCFLASCKKGGVTKCGGLDAAFQCTPLPDLPEQGVTRLAIGGDARDDFAGVVPWAFKEARKRGSNAFFFLGDLELTSAEDDLFLTKIPDLGNVPFYPLMGNHEVETLGFIRMPPEKSIGRVEKFKEKFVRPSSVRPVKFAEIDEVVAYSADLQGGVHLIAMDNVSRAGEGFGDKQLDWLRDDLKLASDAKKTIIVGMHKGLANNPATKHAMDEDGQSAIDDSNKALTLFQQYKVALVVVSHSHMYSAYKQAADKQLPEIEVRLTGGMGAPLVKGLTPAKGALHHFLLVDVPAGENTTPLPVEVVMFPGKGHWSLIDELKEKE